MILYPNLSALKIAGQQRTLLAAAELHLYKEIASPLSVSTVLADLTEADYDGYAFEAIATWLPPYLDPAGGATIQTGTKQFDFTPAAAVTNVVLGFYILDSDGDLVTVGDFPSPIPMAALGDSIPLNVALNWAAPAV